MREIVIYRVISHETEWSALTGERRGAMNLRMTEQPLSPAPIGWYRLARQVSGPHFLAAAHYYRDSLGAILRIADVASPCGRIKVGAIVHFETDEMRPNVCALCRQARLKSL